jgi:hypothetical protein
LNIPNIANYITEKIDPKELAMQIADIITLRPEIQLCYVGISNKCFEFLEARNDMVSGGGTNGRTDNDGGTNGASANVNGATGAVTGAPHGNNAAEDGTWEDEDDEGEGEDTEDEDGEETEEEDGTGGGDGGGPSTGPTDPDETQSENSGGDDSDDDSFVDDTAYQVRLRLREILFYDDKVAIFKARHGKL